HLSRQREPVVREKRVYPVVLLHSIRVEYLRDPRLHQRIVYGRIVARVTMTHEPAVVRGDGCWRRGHNLLLGRRRSEAAQQPEDPGHPVSWLHTLHADLIERFSHRGPPSSSQPAPTYRLGSHPGRDEGSHPGRDVTCQITLSSLPANWRNCSA